MKMMGKINIPSDQFSEFVTVDLLFFPTSKNRGGTVRVDLSNSESLHNYINPKEGYMAIVNENDVGFSLSKPQFEYIMNKFKIHLGAEKYPPRKGGSFSNNKEFESYEMKRNEEQEQRTSWIIHHLKEIADDATEYIVKMYNYDEIRPKTYLTLS